ncbi:MAG: pitrilysin family protein [Verrucomicrobiota bacterium]
MIADTKIHRLSNGVRIATVSMPHMSSVSIGFWTEIGSRFERDDEHGICHLVEHLLFKGTPERDSLEISRQVERLGASIDGFTVEDHTCYHVRGPGDQFLPLLDVLADMYQNPVFDPQEIESEKRVIKEEIAMVQDQPSQLLEDLVSEAAWGENHPLGRSITGSEETLSHLTRDKIYDFHSRAYSGCHTVIAVAGKIDHDEVIAAIEQRIGQLPAGEKMDYVKAPAPRPGHAFKKAPSREQVQLALNFRSADRYDPDRYSQKLLNVLFGENMSSRLFQVVREQLGLCYEVQSDSIAFDDAGLFQIYLALDPAKVPQALVAIDGIIQEFATQFPTEQALDEAVSYTIGQSRLSLESVSSQMIWAGECLLSFDQWFDPEGVHEKLRQVTPSHILSSARNIFQLERLSTALTGPAKAEQSLNAWLKSQTN